MQVSPQNPKEEPPKYEWNPGLHMHSHFFRARKSIIPDFSGLKVDFGPDADNDSDDNVIDRHPGNSQN